MGRPAYSLLRGPGVASCSLGDAIRGAPTLAIAVSNQWSASLLRPPVQRGVLFFAAATRRAESPGYDGRVVRKVLLASPRGYCAGVERAVETVEKALELYG